MLNEYRLAASTRGEHSAYAHLIRFCEPMKQGLQLLFACPPPLQATAQPPHDCRDP